MLYSVGLRAGRMCGRNRDRIGMRRIVIEGFLFIVDIVNRVLLFELLVRGLVLRKDERGLMLSL